mgnify:FL=1
MTNRQETLLEISRRFPKAIEHTCHHMEAHFIPFNMIILNDDEMLLLFKMDDVDEGHKHKIFLAFMDMLTGIGWEFEDTSDDYKYCGAKTVGIVGKVPKNLIEVETRRQFTDGILDSIDND